MTFKFQARTILSEMKRILGALCVLAFCIVSAAALPQQPETTRDIFNTAYESVKPQVTRKSPARRPVTVGTYQQTTPHVALNGVAGESAVGVTIWKLRPPKAGDRDERILLQEGPRQSAWTPVRVATNAPLPKGSLVRLGIEAARTGYLYVIDRELYAGGRRGEPHLIFPSNTIRQGNNEVKKGQIIEIPDREDVIPCFRLSSTDPNHIGEELTVLVTPQPLSGIAIGDQPLKLSEQQVEEWEQRWGRQVGRLELSNGAGKPWTKQEREAGKNSTRLLRANDPGPQTVFYSPEAKANDPVLIKLQLQYRR